MPTSPAPHPALSAFTNLDTPRVWSLLVTVFGDLTPDEGDCIGGPVLTHLTDSMGLKPEAVRVALHRLRKDNWIQSAKSGRTSLHSLTSYGRQLTKSVYDLIYSPLEDMPQDWVMILTPNSDSDLRHRLESAGAVQVMPRLFIAANGIEPIPPCVTLQGTDAPEWLSTQVISADITMEFSQLATALSRVNLTLSDCPQPDPHQTAVIRALGVHYWRRLVLRHPYLPPALTGHNWPGHQCRHEVNTLLQRLPRPKLNELKPE
ncbi:MAG: PaaX family transcriptional regulator C-terminal domain-containing protein [Paracoccaceae bacterium]